MSSSQHTAPGLPVALTEIRGGRSVRVHDLLLSAADRARLAQFGIRLGAQISVIARTAGGGRVVGTRCDVADRVAVDRPTGRRVLVVAE